MTLLQSQTTATARLSQIEHDLDLVMVRFKLANPEEGEAWTPEQLDLAEGEYRKFLALCMAYPEEAIVPCRLVDQFWHQHILDTRAYREDCQRMFGFFYDHYPYFGLNGPDDAANLEAAYEVTLRLYELNFGEPPQGAWRGNAKEKCRTGCKPMKCR
jgi:hypothetical protein